ncbi:MAG: hypothetical protein HY540_04420 [Deltaproteobacteria bacterium]|nr:hypothetical protein [Deltaproteobacteria bacterium]
MKLSSGDDFTCAKLPDGTVKCWGYNDAGQLGQSLQTARSKVPVLVPNLQGVQSIVAGGRHVCVLLIDGRVQCWGDNSHGQLGNGNTTLQTTPVGVSGLTNAVSIAAGADNTCALVKRADPSLELYCWGYNKVCQTGCLENSGGPRENIGLLMDQSFNTPQYIPISIQHQRGQRLPKIVMGNDIDFGAVSICLIPADGSSPRCWGQNHGYQIVDHSQRLVDNANDPSLTLSYQYNSPCWGMAFFPTFLESEEGAVDAAIGQVHACFKRSNSEVVCHGVNSSGQLGVGDRDEHFPVPHRAGQCFPPRPYRAGMTVPADYQFDPVAGVMYIGAPSLPPPPMVTPLPVSGLTSVSKLAAGDYHTCAIKSDGSLWCWGGNGLGQIGDGSRTWAVVPVEINVGGQVSDVDAGMDFTCAVVNGIRVKCWGNGGGGQLGDGQSYYQGSNVPVEVRF